MQVLIAEGTARQRCEAIADFDLHIVHPDTAVAARTQF